MTSKGWDKDMWSHLIKLVSLSKGALIVGVAASAAMVSNAEFSNAPSHNEQPSATPSAIVSTVPTTTPPAESSTKPTNKPATDKPATEPKAKDSGVPSTSAEGLVKECVAKYTALRAAGDNATQGERESASAVCKAAIEQSGLSSSQFAAKYGLETTATSHPTAPTTTTGGLSPDALAMAKECVTKYNLHSADASATCIAAIKLSGLTSSEFAAKFFPPKTTEPTQSPTATKPATAELEGLIYTCRKLQGAIVPGSSAEQVNAASAACAKAIAASGLSTTAFWAKWAPIKPTTTPSATPAPVISAADLAKLIATCLDLYKAMAVTGDTHATSEACGAAIRASGMTSSDFWAKYHPATN